MTVVECIMEILARGLEKRKKRPNEMDPALSSFHGISLSYNSVLLQVH